MSIEVKPVENKKDIKAFIRLPYKVYRGQERKYEAWVPPLDMDVHHFFDRKHNPLYDHAEVQAFLAWENGEVVGRIVLSIDRDFCSFQNTQTAFWGYFEAMENQEIADALMTFAQNWARERKMHRLIGPINGSTNNQLGNQIDSFDTMPVIEMPFATAYYDSMYANAGFTKEKDLYSYKLSTDTLSLSDKIIRVADIARKRNRIEIRTVNMKEWDSELSIVRQIWDEAWADNWGYTPWYQKEFDELAKNMKMIIVPDLTFFAYIDGEPAGFAFPIPDVNFAFHGIGGKLLPFGIFKLLTAKKKATMLRVAALGVRKKYQNKGIDAIFIAELYRRGVKHGFKGSELSWVLEDNLDLRNMLEKWGAEHYRTHRIYGREL